jgi:hypothetical protein
MTTGRYFGLLITISVRWRGSTSSRQTRIRRATGDAFVACTAPLSIHVRIVLVVTPASLAASSIVIHCIASP